MRSVWVGKRQANRTACMVKAQLRLGADEHLADCQILDLSPTGARIKIDPGADLPEMFNIFIPARAETRVCKLRWNRDGQIGVEFVGNEQITTNVALIELNARMAKLEARLAADIVSVSVPAAAEPDTRADSAELLARIEQIEQEQARMMAALQALVNDNLNHDLPGRFSTFESRSAEIHQTLQSLLPILMRRAS